MEDRRVQYPQRYQLKKVEGTDDIYDLIPAPGEITAGGTLVNKSALLKDETAALFKDLPDDPVPDDVFKVLSKAAIAGENGELKTPGGESVPQVKIDCGSYIGTGKSGQSNAVSIKFRGNTPVLVIVSPSYYSATPFDTGFGLIPQQGYWSHSMIWNFGAEKTKIAGSAYEIIFDDSSPGTLTWYTDNDGSSAPKTQMNYAGVTYKYVALSI